MMKKNKMINRNWPRPLNVIFILFHNNKCVFHFLKYTIVLVFCKCVSSKSYQMNLKKWDRQSHSVCSNYARSPIFYSVFHWSFCIQRSSYIPWFLFGFVLMHHWTDHSHRWGEEKKSAQKRSVIVITILWWHDAKNVRSFCIQQFCSIVRSKQHHRKKNCEWFGLAWLGMAISFISYSWLLSAQRI